MRDTVEFSRSTSGSLKKSTFSKTGGRLFVFYTDYEPFIERHAEAVVNFLNVTENCRFGRSALIDGIVRELMDTDPRQNALQCCHFFGMQQASRHSQHCRNPAKGAPCCR
jgi:hypothetical protein